ncbi:3-deoxy-manno-octulosonate cytidylyltransferase [Pelagibacteraceae bacterium]|nr:3-deoxy-manno-octulosonate cytidylyltransferase [Pelagibacteraceae bacterium]
MKTVIVIPSRMASTRFPGKPLAKILGKPMIQRVWEQAIKSNLGEVVVACSEEEIFDLISNLGGRAIITNPKIPTGTDRIYSALKKTNLINDFDYIINLQGDMPLIKSNQIKKVLEPLKKTYTIGTLATRLKENEKTNPNVTKVQIKWEDDSIGNAIDFFRLKKNVESNVYHHVGIYSYTKDSLINFIELPKSINEKLLNLEQYRILDAGISIGIAFEDDIPPSIDTKEDLINSEIIIRENYEKY